MEGEKGSRINIARIFDLQFFKALEKIEEKVDMRKVVAMDEPNDEQGYHGKTKWMREKVAGPITECSVNEFIYTIKKNKERI